MKEQWRQQMQQKMAGYSQPAPEVSWDEIEKAVASRKHHAGVLPLWGRRIAAAVGILLLAGTGYWLIFKERSNEYVVATVTHQMVRPGPQMAEQGKLIEKNMQPGKNVQRLSRQVRTVKGFLAPQPQSLSRRPDLEEETAEPMQREDTVTVVQEHTEGKQAQTFVTPYQNAYHRRYSASASSRLTARLYLSNAVSGGHGSSSVIRPDNGVNTPEQITNENEVESNPVDEPYSIGPDSVKTRADDGVQEYRDVNTSEHVRHHQPIRIGILLRYRLTDRWSLESGLTYTRLLADITSTTEGKSVESKQSLTYIGIPLQVSYQIWKNRHLNVYASAGGLVEKMVDGKRTAQVSSERVTIRPLQFSLNGAVGAEYKFTDWLSIFAEPGMSYYFDNGSSIPTFYQEKPLNFTFSFGLRFSLR